MAQVEECIAHLHEELNLTTAFTGAMVRMGNYRAALGVVEEQRARVRLVPAHFDRAFARPRRKAKAAIAGLAAAALLGSGAFAAWVNPNRSEAAQNQQKIQKAVDMLELATYAQDATLANSYVAVATTVLNGVNNKILPPAPGPSPLKDAFDLLSQANKASVQALNALLAAARTAGVAIDPDDVPKPKPPKQEPPPNPPAGPAAPAH